MPETGGDDQQGPEGRLLFLVTLRLAAKREPRLWRSWSSQRV